MPGDEFVKRMAGPATTVALLTFVATVVLGAWPPRPVMAEDAEPPMEYNFPRRSVPLPQQPWHTHFIDDAKTPDGFDNAGARWTHSFLEKAFAGNLEKTAAQKSWQECGKFLNWAVWGYLSRDSRYRGDERLTAMMREWLDALFARLSTPPTEPRKRKGGKPPPAWEPNRLPFWHFDDYSLPLLEIEARPRLQQAIGVERYQRYRKLVVDNVRRHTTPKSFNSILERSQNYVNMGTHPMAVYIHGWLLTREEKYLRMAMSIVDILDRDVAPNGMFPYRLRLFGLGDRHFEGEAMYYHNVNIEALYMVWWATHSPVAERAIRRSVPYYALMLEPPYHYSSAFDLWFKDQWRTFWPHHVAMVAAVTGDGENATIARAMGKDDICHDRYSLTLGAHAYQQLALAGIAEKPVRNHFIFRDEPMRGLKLRFGRWSASFTAGSSTFSRAGAILTRDVPARRGGTRSAFDALHMARPHVVTVEQRAKRTIEKDYCTLPPAGADHSVAIAERSAAAGTRYHPARRGWPATDHETAPWNAVEVWLLTDAGVVGAIDSVLTKDAPVKELSHQYRFIIAGDGDGRQAGEHTWECGGLRFRLWQTNFAHRRAERAIRYGLAKPDNPSALRDWQLSLTDIDSAVQAKGAEAPPPKGLEGSEASVGAQPTLRAGHRRFSLAEVSPLDQPGFSHATFDVKKRLVLIRAATPACQFLAAYNPSSAGAVLVVPAGDWLRVCSWPEATSDASRIEVPPNAAVLLRRPLRRPDTSDAPP